MGGKHAARGEKKNQRAKITDVAEYAKVSVATVSIILKDPKNNRFSEKTVKKVLAAAEALQYQPALFAQQMKGKHLSVIGLIIPDLMNHFYPEVTTGFSKQANALGYNVILLNSDNSIDQEQVFADALIRMRVAGVAMCGVYSTDERELEVIKRLNSMDIPVVRFDRYNANETCPFVGIDNYHAGYYITEKLIKAGHKKICCLAPKNPVYIVSERCKGYLSAMEKNTGLKAPVAHSMQKSLVLSTRPCKASGSQGRGILPSSLLEVIWMPLSASKLPLHSRLMSLVI